MVRVLFRLTTQNRSWLKQLQFPITHRAKENKLKKPLNKLQLISVFPLNKDLTRNQCFQILMQEISKSNAFKQNISQLRISSQMISDIDVSVPKNFKTCLTGCHLAVCNFIKHDLAPDPSLEIFKPINFQHTSVRMFVIYYASPHH